MDPFLAFRRELDRLFDDALRRFAHQVSKGIANRSGTWR
jgi:hypothetical protein